MITRVATACAAALVASVIAASANPVAAQGTDAGRWVAGDLHIHTTYSHDSYGGPSDDNTSLEEFYTLGHHPGSQFAVAASRGLDYLALTDHNDVRSQGHFGEAGDVIPVAGYEKSLSGHAQMLGARHIYDAGDKSAAAINETADALRADGGIFQVNHPMEGTTDHGATPDWGYGFDVAPDTIEVWNISRLWQPPAPSASSNDDAVLWWQEWLDRGYKVAATGGSDNHYLATTPVQGAGQPTTWVYVTEESEAGILAGLRAGRTFISHQPPAYGGPRLFLEADGDGDGVYESIVGDEVPVGSDLRVRVEDAPGALLRIVTTGGDEPVDEQIVTSADFTFGFELGDGSTWVRAELVQRDLSDERAGLCDGSFGSQTTYCRNALAVLAMTSALYLGTPEADPVATSLTYVGDTVGRGSTVRVAALLADEAGAPVSGEQVAFTIGDDTYTATTGPDGIAEATATVEGHGRSQTVHVVYGGSPLYLPSSTAATIVWGRPN